MSAIARNSSAVSLTIANSAAVSNVFSMAGVAGGILLMPDTWTPASIGFKVCDTADGTFLPLYDAAAAIVEIDGPSVDTAYSLPAELFGSLYVKLWSQDGAGSDTNQAAEREVKVVLKS